MKLGFEQLLGVRTRPGCLCVTCRSAHEDPRLRPVKGDEVDELVNWQIEQGKARL